MVAHLGQKIPQVRMHELRELEVCGVAVCSRNQLLEALFVRPEPERQLPRLGNDQ